MFANPELGIGDATGMGPGDVPGGRKGPCAHCESSCNSAPVPAASVRLHASPVHRRYDQSASLLLQASRSAMPFDTSLQAGLEEIEMTCYRAVEDALQAAGVKACEVRASAVQCTLFFDLTYPS